MFFRRVLTFATVVASLALLSYARPMHHARATVAITTAADGANTVLNSMYNFQKEVVSCSDNISQTVSTGGNPEADIKKLTTLFANMDPPKVSLNNLQQKEVAGIVSLSLTKAISSCHEVSAKHNFMKYYAAFTDLDFSMHSLTQKCAGISFSMYKESLVGAGKPTAIKCHDMKMRHLVNDFRGMGISYE